MSESDVKNGAHVEVKPKVPSLLDLNPFDMKVEVMDDNESNQDIPDTHMEDEIQSGEQDENNTTIPFKLKKKHLYTAFRMHYSFNSVIIKPFRADFFTNPTVQLWVRKAKEFSMRQGWSGTSVGMMLFCTYKDAHTALTDLRLALGIENTELEIRHSLNKPETPYRYPHEEVEYIMKDRTDQPLLSRVMVLEDLPEGTTEDDLNDYFPDARTVIVLTHGDDMKGYGLVEFPAPHKLRDALNDYKTEGEEKGSSIEVKGQEVKLTKFLSRYNQGTYWLRMHPPKAEPKKELEDEERVEICRNLKAYLAERDAVLNVTEPEGTSDDAVELYWVLTEKMQALAKRLNYDTMHRKMLGKKFPESKDLKINPITILGYPDEEDEEITGSGGTFDRPPPSASGKIPSLMDVNFFTPQVFPQRKRISSSRSGPSPKKSTGDMDSSLEKGDWQGSCIQQIPGCDGSMMNPTPLMAASSENRNSGSKKTKSAMKGPLETTRWCSIPLPLKKPLASRHSQVEERLYVVSYPRKFDDRILENVLCRFGGLMDAYFSKGSNYGYAKFADKSSAHEAAYVLHGQIVAGNTVTVSIADVPGESYRGGHRNSRD